MSYFDEHDLELKSFEAKKDYMRSLPTREIGGDVLFYRGDNDCLTVMRGGAEAYVSNVEGEWTEDEQDAACAIYEEFNASKV